MSTSTTDTVIPVAAGTWTVDTAHSSVEFVVRHMGLSKVRGRFGSFDARLVAGEDLASSSISAEVELASVSTNNDDRDAHLKSSDFFDAEKNPKMTFASTAIEHVGDGWTMTGDLTINGITRPVTFDVEFYGAEVSPADQQLHAAFSATGTISRKSYGIEFDAPVGADKMLIGDKVAIELEAQFVQS